MSLESTISVKIPSIFLAKSSNSPIEDLQNMPSNTKCTFVNIQNLLIGTVSVRVEI
jgi:hypothetical protein